MCRRSIAPRPRCGLVTGAQSVALLDQGVRIAAGPMTQSGTRILAGATTAILDLARFAATPLVHAPFDHLIVPGFIAPAALPALNAAFPAIAKGGSYSTG